MLGRRNRLRLNRRVFSPSSCNTKDQTQFPSCDRHARQPEQQGPHAGGEQEPALYHRSPIRLRSSTQVEGTLRLGVHLEKLDAIAVGILDEREAVAALADRVGRLLGLDALLAQA